MSLFTDVIKMRSAGKSAQLRTTAIGGRHSNEYRDKYMAAGQFWNSKRFGEPFSIINGINTFARTPTQLYNLQKKILTDHFKTKNYDSINTFLNNIKNQKYDPNHTVDEIITAIFNVINSPFTTSRSTIGLNGEHYTNIPNRLQYLQELLQKINVNTPIPESMIQALSIGVHALSKDGNTQELFYKYTRAKAMFAEQLANDFINSNGTHTGGGLVTGQIVNTSNQQLIIDVITILKDKNKFAEKLAEKGVYKYTAPEGQTWKETRGILQNSLDSAGIKFNIQANGIESFDQLTGFLNDFTKTGTNGYTSFVFSDEALDFINKSGAMRTQVKSGTAQEIFNRGTGRTSTTLESINTGVQGYSSEILNKLSSLYTETKFQPDFYFKKNQHMQENLTAYGNYLLSWNIAKTVITKNDVYFTDRGLLTAVDWLAGKGTKNATKSVIMFTRGIALSAQFMKQSRGYKIQTVK